ncbi:MAG: orotate phosphoribosyltransferase [Kiritimatiellales bacterium]
MTENEMLKIFEDTKALLNGHFELRSKLHSDKFFQCALLLQYPRIAAQVCAALAEKMKTTPGLTEVDTVISPALGGIPVGHEVARALDKRFIFVEKNADKMLELRRFKIEAGERFLVAEDVITRGGRVQETVDIVEQHGGIVKSIGVLVDRSGGKAQFNYPLVSLLNIEPVTWEPAECPLCKQGQPLIHPGS